MRQQPSEASGCGGALAKCLGVPPPDWLAVCLSGSISVVEGAREGREVEGGMTGGREGGLEE